MFAVLRSTAPGDFVNINWFSFVGDGDGQAAGWVPVDQAKWNAQVAQFRAMTPAPVPADVVRVPEFNATCDYSHSKPDDPIVLPGLAGASHMHSFFGNKSTDAFSTTQSLLDNKATTCAPAEDLSAYWIPSLYEGNRAVEPENMIVYYGSRLPDPSATLPFPEGFRMIAGDARAQTSTPADRRASTGAPTRAARSAAAPTATGRSVLRPHTSPTSLSSPTAGTARTWTAPTTSRTSRTPTTASAAAPIP